jgi:hypothetical protein
MINPIAHVETRTEPLPAIDLVKARRIQARLKKSAAAGLTPTEGYLWSPLHGGPFTVPITRWIE